MCETMILGVFIVVSFFLEPMSAEDSDMYEFVVLIMVVITMGF